MSGSAEISQCGQYRYLLTRSIPATEWGVGDAAREAVFIMLNPSTADATTDDPTIRRCLGFARAWRRTGLTVANLYALRSTDPTALWRHRDPIGPENDTWLAWLARQYRELICAWGANAKPDRVAQFKSLVAANGGKLVCLGITKAGAPRHPLYLRGDSALRPLP